MAECILVVRLSAIGDIVMASCLAEGLKQRYPDAKISWLVQSGMEDLLQANPFVDEVIVWPRKQWQQLWQQHHYLTLFTAIKRFCSALRKKGFTLAIDAQGLLKSATFARISGAKRRIGLDPREGSARLMTEVFHAPHSKQIGAEYRYLLQQLAAGAPAKMTVATTTADQQHSAALLQQQEVTRPFVVLCPFSTRRQKNWTTEQWLDLARQIDTELALDCVILGATADQQDAKATAGQQHSLFEFAGQTSLRQAAAMIQSAHALVGVDTGLTHMGVVGERPTVALFGSTCPYLYTDSRVAKVIYHQLSCAPCKRKPTCDGGYQCMQDITVAEVMTALTEVLNA